MAIYPPEFRLSKTDERLLILLAQLVLYEQHVPLPNLGPKDIVLS